MLAIPLLILAGASSPDESAIRQQASRCGLTPDRLVWTRDSEGRKRALITPNGDLDHFSFAALSCLLTWAERTGAPVGFVSAPLPRHGPPPKK